MTRDARYITVKNLITAGYIKSFREMFPTIRKSIVAHDLGMNNSRFTTLMNDVKKFTLEELYLLAKFLDVEEKVVLNLVHEQYEIDKKKKIKR
jgi:plasmid maintenance system antidote protein VapI